MKKRIVTGALIAAFGAVAVTGGTLAYFTDTDAKTNTFTMGNVQIALLEEFGDNDPQTPEKLVPATGSVAAGNLQNAVKKEVTVKNTGSETAYVRVHIAVPSVFERKLHLDSSERSKATGQWQWGSKYETTINGVDYDVYPVTYGTALKTEETTATNAIDRVYLDNMVTNEQVEQYMEALDEEVQIKVLAEAVQAAGFDDAATALNEAFGTPGNYTLDWSGAVNQ